MPIQEFFQQSSNINNISNGQQEIKKLFKELEQIKKEIKTGNCLKGKRGRPKTHE
jgi:hypothetical protein